MKSIVVSLGGSVIIPDKIDLGFLREFSSIIQKTKDRFIIICGGGRLARELQMKARKKGLKGRELDWLGIYATRINAASVKEILHVKHRVILNPKERIKSKEKIIIAAGWKPGFSTDYDAVLLAKNTGAKSVVNMTNVDYVYDKDPKIAGARAIKEIRWVGLRKIVGSKWKPGLNMPFDPIASKEAEKLRMKVVIIGKDLKNFKKFLDGKEFKGTVIR
jgi:uridylate kinase